MGQRGFWDEQHRVEKLQEKKPVLKRLSESIPWESFRPLLERGYAHERKSNAGRKRIDPLILFKMLVLQQLFNLSDEELEFQVNDRRSFEEFVGLGVMNNIPDATTIAFFRERLRKASVYAFRGRDAPAQDCTPDGPSLSDQAAVLCLPELRDPAAVTASPHRGDGQSRPAPGTARHRDPVA
jgi:Transposase and inactivated derivatives, IS5 family